MKSLYTTLALALIVSAGYAQSKLADTSRIKLTAPQIIAISAKVDSMQMLLSNTSTLPGYQIAAFNARVQACFMALWLQVQAQAKKDEKPKK